MQAWSGLGPGLRETKQWDEWLKVADFPVGDVVVDVRNIPALTRRRLGHLAKMAVSVAARVKVVVALVMQPTAEYL